jgi:hypothetical protein
MLNAGSVEILCLNGIVSCGRQLLLHSTIANAGSSLSTSTATNAAATTILQLLLHDTTLHREYIR